MGLSDEVAMVEQDLKAQIELGELLEREREVFICVV